VAEKRMLRQPDTTAVICTMVGYQYISQIKRTQPPF